MRLASLYSLCVLSVLMFGAYSQVSFQRVNQTCPIYSYWNTQTCINCQNYCTCKTPNGCDTITCPQGSVQASSSQTCVSCPLGCLQCTVGSGFGNFQCSSCNPGFQLINNICVLLTTQAATFTQPFDEVNTYVQFYNTYQNCMLIDTQTTFCQQCIDQFFLNEVGSCEACTQGCLQCNSRGTCSKCLPQYFWLPNGQQKASISQLYGLQQYGSLSITVDAVYAMGSFLLIKKGAGMCGQCNDPFAVLCTNMGQNSTSCTSAYYLDTVASKCQQCQNGCLNCTNSATCQLCGAGLYLQTGSCNQCFGNTLAPYSTPCLSCNSGMGASCDTCNTAAGFLKINQNCVQCSTLAGCQTCNSFNNTISCQICQNGLYRTLDSNKIATCSSCNTTSTNQGTQYCYKDDYGGQPSVVITQCQQGSLLVKQATSTVNLMVCIQNNNNCLTAVNSDGLCATCFMGDEIINGQCQTCGFKIPGCQTCKVQSNGNIQELRCKACASKSTTPYPYGPQNYALNSDSNTCTKCPAECSECTPDNKCSACRNTFSLNGTTCSACSTTYCSSCNPVFYQLFTKTCTQCLDGYFLFTQPGLISCLPCPKGCLTCGTDGNQCKTCISGYYLANGGCNNGKLFCSNFNSDGTCSKCQYGFRLQSQSCYPCIAFQQGYVCGQNAGSSCWSKLIGAAILILLAFLQ